MNTTPFVLANSQPVLATDNERGLLQLLLNMASPRAARYVGHAIRSDSTYRVVVHIGSGFRTLSIPVPVLSLIAEGILVEQDRACVLAQLL
ncbi:hypothetical protein CLV58_11894 [Spirosoma oryzae]|uniref:Uncharacterized protein n=2 Tax=Spirosoma oryzae TaxID=1469603 RepID=A0A2T0SLD5_9BACT|nr:hypothetical protein CLV58_11894 [Spirosoma oryzae]